MKLTNYRRVDRDIAAMYINDYLGVKSYQANQQMEEALMKHGYVVVVKEEKIPSSIVFRFTYPLYLIAGLILFIYLCMKWLITGNRFLDINNRLYKIIKSWQQKMGVDH